MPSAGSRRLRSVASRAGKRARRRPRVAPVVAEMRVLSAAAIAAARGSAIAVATEVPRALPAAIRTGVLHFGRADSATAPLRVADSAAALRARAKGKRTAEEASATAHLGRRAAASATARLRGKRAGSGELRAVIGADSVAHLLAGIVGRVRMDSVAPRATIVDRARTASTVRRATPAPRRANRPGGRGRPTVATVRLASLGTTKTRLRAPLHPTAPRRRAPRESPAFAPSAPSSTSRAPSAAPSRRSPSSRWKGARSFASLATRRAKGPPLPRRPPQATVLIQESSSKRARRGATYTRSPNRVIAS